MKLRQIIPGQVLNLDQLHYIASRNKQQDTIPSPQLPGGSWASQPPSRFAAKRTSDGLVVSDRQSFSQSSIQVCSATERQRGRLLCTCNLGDEEDNRIPCCWFQFNGRWDRDKDNNSTGEFRSAIYCTVKCRYYNMFPPPPRHETIESLASCSVPRISINNHRVWLWTNVLSGFPSVSPILSPLYCTRQ